MITESSDGEKRLYADLLINASYNKRIRPRHDPTQTVIVDLELDLNHLIKLVRQTFCSVLYQSRVSRLTGRQCCCAQSLDLCNYNRSIVQTMTCAFVDPSNALVSIIAVRS